MKFNLGCRALVAAGSVLVVAAPTAGAYVGGPGNGKPFTSDRPDLRSAVVLNAAFGNKVRFCFDQPVDQIRATSTAVAPGPDANGDGAPDPVATTIHNFLAQTYDANRFMVATSAAKDVEDPACVVATFGDVQLDQGTVGAVNDGAVIDAANRPNLRDSVPLTGTAVSNGAGFTTGPDLVSVQPEGNQALYTFDEPLSGESDTGFLAQFAGGDTNGSTSAAIRAENPRQVLVTFSRNVASAARFLVRGGAVADRPQDRYVAGQGGVDGTATPNGADATSGGVSVPVLTGVTRIDASTLEATFSRPGLKNGAANAIQLVLDDGRFFQGSSIQVIESQNNTARVTFVGEPWKEPGAVMRVADVGGAVQSSDTFNSSVGVVRTGTAPVGPGVTNAPDLLAASFDVRTSETTFRFDEEVGDFGPARLFFAAGRTVDDVFAGSGTVVSTTTSVRVNTGTPSSAGTGAGVTGANQLVNGNTGDDVLYTSGSVSAFDAIDLPGPRGLVSFETEPFPPAGGGGAPGGTGTTPPPVVTPITTIPPRVRYVSRVTLKRSGSTRRRKYSGRVSSEGRGCRSGRRVVIKVRTSSGRTRTITSTFSKGDGTFSLRRKRITGGRVYAFVTERGGQSVFCRSGSSSRIRG